MNGSEEQHGLQQYYVAGGVDPRLALEECCKVGDRLSLRRLWHFKSVRISSRLTAQIDVHRHPHPEHTMHPCIAAWEHTKSFSELLHSGHDAVSPRLPSETASYPTH